MPLDLPTGRTEADVLDRMRELADRNQVLVSLIGQGYSGTITPPVIQRNLLENPAWYTAYTPYQPEISQGRLEALLNFQTMVSDLTGMDLANASLLDEATAAAEAMTMLRRVNAKGGDTFFVDAGCHPQTIDVVRTRAEPLGIDVVVGPPEPNMSTEGVFGVLLQYPGTTGAIRDDRALVADPARAGHARRRGDRSARAGRCSPRRGSGAPTWSSVPRSASACPWPTAVRTRRSSPRARSTRRNLPGRLVGVSVDTEGRPALRLALQTREQHIRREKATSNICTAQVLLANIAGMYAVYHGPDGLRAIAERVHEHATELARSLAAEWCTRRSSTPSRSGYRARSTTSSERGHDAGVNLRRVDDTTVGIAFDETTTPEIVRTGARAVREPGEPRTPRGSPTRCDVSPTSSRTRCSARTTPSRSCCGTCASSPTATSPSTAR